MTMDEPELLTRIEGSVGRLTLNRPKALHALTLGMCQAMTDALMAWRDDPAVKLVLLDHSGERGFCAGGDIKALAESGRGDGSAARFFFHTEYRLNHLLFVYPKPVVAVMDGVTMGGGVGITDPARYRVATERTTYAMPETGIGLFPDVGGGWFLPRMPGNIGRWLSLTGARIKAADCELIGVATDYIESAKIPEFKARLVADPDAVETLLTELEGDAGRPPLAAVQDKIDRLFGGETMEAIFAALAADGSEWASEQLAILRTKSPHSMKVSLRQMQRGAAATSFAEHMAMEYRIGARQVMTHDFLEGVRAVVVEKDNKPAWKPATIEGVTEADIDRIFAPLPPDEEWTPLEGVA
jgi:enoyl-CoA hydratase